MKYIFLLVVLSVAFVADAQNHMIGLKVGSNNTDISTSQFLMDHNPKSGWLAGFTYDYHFLEQFYFGAALMYDQRGFTNDIIFTDNTGTEYERYTADFEYNYLSLPISAGFNFGNKLYGFVEIAAVPSFLLDANYIFPAFNSKGELIGEEVIDAGTDVNTFDFAGKGEFGLGYKIKQKFYLYASFAYQQSITTTYESQYFMSDDMKHYGTAMSIGLKYILPEQ